MLFESLGGYMAIRRLILICCASLMLAACSGSNGNSTPATGGGVGSKGDNSIIYIYNRTNQDAWITLYIHAKILDKFVLKANDAREWTCFGCLENHYSVRIRAEVPVIDPTYNDVIDLGADVVYQIHACISGVQPNMRIYFCEGTTGASAPRR